MTRKSLLMSSLSKGRQTKLRKKRLWSTAKSSLQSDLGGLNQQELIVCMLTSIKSGEEVFSAFGQTAPLKVAGVRS